MRFRVILYILVVFASSLPKVSGANPDTAPITAERFASMKEKGELVAIFSEARGLSLMPEFPARDRIVNEVLSAHPTIGVELLAILEVPGPADQYTSTIDQALANSFRSISTASGLECYIPDTKTRGVFFKTAQVITSPADPSPLPDPIVFGKVPAKSISFALFDDAVLGRFICAVEFGVSGGVRYMSMHNTDDIWMFVFPIIAKGNARNVFLVFRYGANFIFYGLNCVNTTNIFGISDGLADDFHYRIQAIKSWYEGNFTALVTGF